MSLLVLTGYGCDLFDDCCCHPSQIEVNHGQSVPSKQTPAHDQGCQCVCHQIVTPITIDPVRVADAALLETVFFEPVDEIAPDTVPLGIEYPPQLA